MARIESGRMEIDENYCRIEDVWKSLFAVFDEKARKKNISLHYTMNVEHEHVLTDVTKVKEILVNILSNSIKYTPVGGSVMVDVDELSCDESGYMIERIRVIDTGIGMSQDYLTKIFEAFTREKNTTKSKIAGTGLGMSIVKNYVDLLGGTIDVESELGKGSTFTVTLKHRIADERYYVKKHIEEPGTGNEILEGRNILLAEDNDLNAEIAEAILARAGLRIERVENGIQCVNRILKMPAGTYDMIFMDIQMPEMDGFELCGKIKSNINISHVPVILLTAKTDTESKIKGLEAGADAYIEKPFSPFHLKAQLLNLLKKRESQQKTYASTPLSDLHSAVHNKLDEEFMNKCTEIIQNNIEDSEFSVNTLAQELGMSRTSVFTKIKGIIGMTPNDFIKVTRLKKACKMMVEGEYRVTEIGFLVGFSSSSYFAKCFQKQFGMLPTEFLKKIKEDPSSATK